MCSFKFHKERVWNFLLIVALCLHKYCSKFLKMELLHVSVLCGKSFGHVRLFVTLWSHQAPLSVGFWSGTLENTGVDCHVWLQGIFPIQGSNQVS